MGYHEDYGLSAEQLDDKYNQDGNGQHPEFTRARWVAEVSSENTLRGYWDWVVAQIEDVVFSSKE